VVRLAAGQKERVTVPLITTGALSNEPSNEPSDQPSDQP
jgi:hypothetical protein